MFEPKQKHSTHSTTLDCTLLQPGRAVIFNGLDLNQFSVANGTAGDQLHLPFSSAVSRPASHHFLLPQSTKLSREGNSAERQWFYNFFFNSKVNTSLILTLTLLQVLLDIYRRREIHICESSCPLTSEDEFEFWGLGEIFLQPCCALKYFPKTVRC